MLLLFGRATLDTKFLTLPQFWQGRVSILAFANEQDPSLERKQDTGYPVKVWGII